MILFIILTAVLGFVFTVVHCVVELRRKAKIIRVWLRRQENLAEITLHHRNFPNRLPSKIQLEIQRLERRQHHYERHLGRLKFKWEDEEWIEEHLQEMFARRWGYGCY